MNTLNGSCVNAHLKVVSRGVVYAEIDINQRALALIQEDMQMAFPNKCQEALKIDPLSGAKIDPSSETTAKANM